MSEIKRVIYISKESDDKVHRYLSATTPEEFQGADKAISLPVDMEYEGMVMNINCNGCDEESSYAEIVLFSHGCEVNCIPVPTAKRFCGTWSIPYHGDTYTVVVKQSTLDIRSGNLLNVQKGIIAHQVNCRHVMGGGLALQLRKAYPKHYNDYMADTPRLGTLCITEMDPTFFVVGIYGQDNFGREKVQTDYDALKSGLAALHEFSKQKGLPVYLPFMLGCGLAGGDWKRVLRIMEETVPGCTILNPNG